MWSKSSPPVKYNRQHDVGSETKSGKPTRSVLEDNADVSVRLDDLVQPDDVRMSHLLQMRRHQQALNIRKGTQHSLTFKT